MATHDTRAESPDGPHPVAVIAFDIDNTLLDPTGEGYRRTVEAFLAHTDTGLSPRGRQDL